MKNKIELKNEWSLFLDRDGVINKRFPGGYVRKPSEFTFLPGSLFALKLLSDLFKNIFIVTNQQGIGKGLMTAFDLQAVHRQMMGEIKDKGGRIDRIFFCPDLKTKTPNCRKPGLAMAQMAKKEFPSINFQKSYMVGDSMVDIEFGQNADMHCIYIRSEEEDDTLIKNIPKYSSLLEFARTFNSI